LFSSIP